MWMLRWWRLWRVLMLRRREAVRHAVGRRISVVSMFHVVRGRQCLRTVRRRGRRVGARVRRCRGGPLLVRGVVGVGAIYGRGRGMTRPVVLAVRVVLLPLARGVMRVLRGVSKGWQALRVGRGRRRSVWLLQRR